MILISKCLLGYPCKYNGGNNLNEKAVSLNGAEKCIAACPEQLGGLQTPREPCEILGGTGKDVLDKTARVVSKDGKDCTEEFLKGAQRTLELAKLLNVKKAVLKARSPSCGVCGIYDGTFSGTVIGGAGVTAELLRREGIEVISEEEL